MNLNLKTLAEEILKGRALSKKEGLQILRTPPNQFKDLLNASLQVREHYFGRRVKVAVLKNARSGLCGEDCSYCSQSKVSKAPIEKYPMQSLDSLVEGARATVEAGAKRYCMVISNRGPTDKDVEHLAEAARRIKQKWKHLEICCSVGLITKEQVLELKKAGAGWINHNLNTSERFYPQICTTHTYADRFRTLRYVQEAGLNICSGGIIGMGEEDGDIVDMALTLRQFNVRSLPVNTLHPMEGTPLQDQPRMDPERGLRALCLFRLTSPKAEIRAAGGREITYTGEYEKWVFYPANSVFAEGYLTTGGQSLKETCQVIRKAGFEPEIEPEEVAV
ncbi:MAG: biotin synthase BioB [Candidatus Omnitrophica bacterium]|nr:biotin synthase BioB [Candidatus Omnitrophota bacterium]